MLHSTDPLDPDTDGDGASDGDVVAQGTDPLTSQVNGDLNPSGAPDVVIIMHDLLLLRQELMQ